MLALPYSLRSPLYIDRWRASLQGTSLYARLRMVCGWVGLFLAVGGCPEDDGPGFVPVPVLASVDPIIGTAGAAYGQPQTFVGATTPFGLIKLGPDTSGELPRGVDGFAHTSGYWYLDGYIDGFSHLHLSGTGVEDLGNFLIMPATSMSAEMIDEDGYRQPFSHASEEVSPGRYAVRLDGNDVYAELTAAPHAGMHRYRFAADAPSPHLIVDVSHGIGRNGAVDAALRYEGGGHFSGWMHNAGRFTSVERAFPVYVSMHMTPEPILTGGWEGEVFHAEQSGVQGENIGMFARFPMGTREVTVRVGVSLIDENQARNNRSQIDGKTFEKVHEEARSAWQTWLERIELESADTTQSRIFYTSLYHAALMPTRYSEPLEAGHPKGRYRGLDREIHNDDNVSYYSDFSLWDTYRSAHPLYALIAPKYASAFATSLVRMARAHGALPRWPLAVNETGTMLGSPAIIALADTWLRGAIDFDAERALQISMDDADSTPGKTSRFGHTACLQAGFCPREEVSRGVAHAAEWSVADFALSRWLSAQARADASVRYEAQSLLFVGHIDENTGFARGRSLVDDFDSAIGFDPTELTDDYAEGNAWQYLFSAPHAVAAMAKQLGEERLLWQVRTLFERAKNTAPRYLGEEWRQPDPFYWHGNEPDLHAAFVPLLLGDADATAEYVDWILRTKYDDTPLGLDGNDDGGTLSSWYVLAAIGLFPLPGSDLWLCVPPRFSKIRLAREVGELVIEVDKETPNAMYLHGIELDGRGVDRAWLRHHEVAQTKHLRFRVGEKPVGFAAAAARPPLPQGESSLPDRTR